MPICPVCGAEYVTGTFVCSDCQASLVEMGVMPCTPEVEVVRWARLMGVPNQVAGVMLLGVLEGADIPARLEERTIPVYGAVPSSWSEDSWGELLVPEEHLALASALVEDYLSRVEGTLSQGERTGSPKRWIRRLLGFVCGFSWR